MGQRDSAAQEYQIGDTARPVGPSQCSLQTGCRREKGSPTQSRDQRSLHGLYGTVRCNWLTLPINRSVVHTGNGVGRQTRMLPSISTEKEDAATSTFRLGQRPSVKTTFHGRANLNPLLSLSKQGGNSLRQNQLGRASTIRPALVCLGQRNFPTLAFLCACRDVRVASPKTHKSNGFRSPQPRLVCGAVKLLMTSCLLSADVRYLRHTHRESECPYFLKGAPIP